MKETLIKRIIVGVFSALVLGSASSAWAAASVAWTSPPNGSTFPTGTIVNPTGQAAGSGQVGGSGLDLALVIDTSGSMAGAGITAARAAAIALVNALPVPTTSVAVIEFDSVANTVRVLSPLASDKAAIIAAINSLSTGGGTTIGAGIDRARVELTGALHTVGRSQQMVVLSDGSTSGNPEVNAVAAIAAGIDAIHTVGIPGHNVATMRDIADGPDDIVGTADDYGVYTNVSSLDQLVGIFNGTGGNLVNLDRIDITLPDGTLLSDYATDGLGNFTLPNWALQAGANTFGVTAYATDGTSASATLTLNGSGGSNGVPDTGSTVLLLGLALTGLRLIGMKKVAIS